MWPTAIITICKYLIGSWWCVNRSVLCPSGPLVKSKSQVYLCASYEYLTLGYSITRLESQNRKFAPILIITGPKNDHFCVCKQTGFVDQRLSDFAKMTLTRVSSHWLWLESIRVTIFLNVTRVESESPKIVTRFNSSHWLESRYHCSMARHARDSMAPLWWSSAGWMPARIRRLSTGVGRRHPVTIRKASLMTESMRRVWALQHQPWT